jgi:hypothetical protein
MNAYVVRQTYKLKCEEYDETKECLYDLLTK